MRYHLKPITTATIEKKKNSNCQQECGEIRTLGRNVKTVQLLLKTIWQFHKKLKIELPCDDPAIPLLSTCTKELKEESQRDFLILIFTAALFTTGKTWKQPKCSYMGEWINKMWHVYTSDYYSTLRKKEILTHTTT